MHRIGLLLASLLVGLAAQTSAAGSTGEEVATSRPPAILLTLKNLIGRVAEGRGCEEVPNCVDKLEELALPMATRLGLQPGTQGRKIVVGMKSTPDHKGRAFWLLLDPRQKDEWKRARHLMFFVLSNSPTATGSVGVAYNFLSDAKGQLQKVAVTRVEYDQQFNQVPGKSTHTDSDSPTSEMREALSHELDYWLRDAYQKKDEASGTMPEPRAKEDH